MTKPDIKVMKGRVILSGWKQIKDNKGYWNIRMGFSEPKEFNSYKLREKPEWVEHSIGLFQSHLTDIHEAITELKQKMVLFDLGLIKQKEENDTS